MEPTRSRPRASALVLADGDELTYRVMRCVCDAGLRVHVLGTEGSTAARLSRSRYCAGLYATAPGSWASGAALAQVNALAAALDVRLVLASDPATTRFVAWHGGAIDAAVFPVPERTTFERLVNKDSFAQVCAVLGLPHPRTAVYGDAEELVRALPGLGAWPSIIKPVDGYAGHGVWKLERGDPRAPDRIRALGYRPILVQDFIRGDDVNALLLCEAGRITACIAYHLGATAFTVVDDAQLCELLAHACGALNLEGAVGFDLRRDLRGRWWFLECNPRFTYEGSLVALLAGYNIVRQFLAPGSLAPRAPAGRMRRAKLLRPWSLLGADLRHTRYLLADPRHSVAQACREFYQTKLRGAAPGFAT